MLECLCRSHGRHRNQNRISAFLVPIRPQATFQHDSACLSHIRSRAPARNVVRFLNLAHLTIVATATDMRNAVVGWISRPAPSSRQLDAESPCNSSRTGRQSLLVPDVVMQTKNAPTMRWPGHSC